MDEQLLQDLYGVTGDEPHAADEDMVKQAQAELIEAVADEAGIDLNEMDDEELEKFASYVLSPEAAELEGEADYAEESGAYYADPYEEADQMGRVMAHAYADEQMKIASAMEHESNYENALVKVAHSWDMLKVAKDEKAFKDRTVGELGAAAGKRISKMTGYRDIKRGLELASLQRGALSELKPEHLKSYMEGRKDFKSNFAALSKNQRRALLQAELAGTAGLTNAAGLDPRYIQREASKRALMRGSGKAALTLGGLTAAGLGIKKLRER